MWFGLIYSTVILPADRASRAQRACPLTGRITVEWIRPAPHSIIVYDNRQSHPFPDWSRSGVQLEEFHKGKCFLQIFEANSHLSSQKTLYYWVELTIYHLYRCVGMFVNVSVFKSSSLMCMYLFPYINICKFTYDSFNATD